MIDMGKNFTVQLVMRKTLSYGQPELLKILYIFSAVSYKIFFRNFSKGFYF